MTITTTTAEHLHERPGWDCRVCKQPWPCPDARAVLLEEFHAFPSVLTIYLTSQMYEAMGDMTTRGMPAPLEMYQRFLSWAHKF